MESKDVGLFISGIQKTLEKNGFPERKVALPLEKMYEVAHSKGVNFNKVLAFMETKGIGHKKTAEKIIFFAQEDHPKKTTQEDKDLATSFMGDMNFSQVDMSKVNIDSLLESASDLMSQLTPGQLDEIKNKVKNLSTEQLATVKKTFSSMNDEDRKDLVDRAKKIIK